MESNTKHVSKLIAISVLTGLFAFGATQAYAIDNGQKVKTQSNNVWVEAKTAVTDTAALIVEDNAVPSVIIPLQTQIDVEASTPEKIEYNGPVYQKNDLRNFDLIEDNPIYIGARKDPEFDTLEARRAQASYSKSLNVDPLITVAGAGLVTNF